MNLAHGLDPPSYPIARGSVGWGGGGSDSRPRNGTEVSAEDPSTPPLSPAIRGATTGDTTGA
eukprot:510524-Hanusia_phi.AAC.1